MGPMSKRIFKLEFVGFVFIVLAGSLLHFVFEWSGSRTWVALFAAVNESTWEHLKLAFYPAVLFSIVEFPFFKDMTKNFLVAKTVSFYVMPISIIILFYGYMLVLKEDSLFWDILTFILAIAAGQFVSYRILISRKLPELIQKASVVFLVLISLSFLLFTYFPLHNFLFKDPITGGVVLE